MGRCRQSSTSVIDESSEDLDSEVSEPGHHSDGNETNWTRGSGSLSVPQDPTVVFAGSRAARHTDLRRGQTPGRVGSGQTVRTDDLGVGFPTNQNACRL